MADKFIMNVPDHILNALVSADSEADFIALLEKETDFLEKNNMSAEQAAKTIMDDIREALASGESMPTPPCRVRVHNGDGSKLLGMGTYEKNVEVYFVHKKDGYIQSLHNAEKKPTDEELAELLKEGDELICSPDNPRIKLDNGDVVYGCQVWWEVVNEG